MKKTTLLLAAMALVCMSLSLSASAQNADTLYFYKGGQIVIKIPVAEIDSFTFTPQAPVSQGYGIDLAMTAQYGGIVYDLEVDPPEKGRNVIYLYNQGVKVFIAATATWVNFPWSQINKDWKTMAGGKEFRLIYTNWPYQGKAVELAIIYLADDKTPDGYDIWVLHPVVVNGVPIRISANSWRIGPFVSSQFLQNSDGSLTIGGITAKEW